ARRAQLRARAEGARDLVDPRPAPVRGRPGACHCRRTASAPYPPPERRLLRRPAVLTHGLTPMTSRHGLETGRVRLAAVLCTAGVLTGCTQAPPAARAVRAPGTVVQADTPSRDPSS